MNKLPQHIEELFDEKFPPVMNYGSGSKKYLENIKSFIATILNEETKRVAKKERKNIIKEYGHFNDGCGCCARENLGNELERITRMELLINKKQ